VKLQYEVQMTNIPNDLYLFSAWQEAYVNQATLFGKTLDLEDINKNILAGSGSQVSKVSCALLAEIISEYIILPVGATLTRFCSPKIVSRGEVDSSKLFEFSLTIPGRNTTAFFLVKNLLPKFKEIHESCHDEILASFKKEEKNLTLMIHSTKSLEEEHGLKEVVNLYDLWVEKTGQNLLPLGCLVAKRSLGKEKLLELTNCLSRSLSYADENQAKILDLIMQRTRTQNKEAILQGINAWVTDETRSISKKGEEAIFCLLKIASPEDFKRWSPEELIFNPNK
jgi:1,4-dihydroxy-6-naphthoate synthase